MTLNNSHNKGSEWRIWDLHVHTPASHSYKGSYEEFITNAKDSVAAVIGINDYCTVDGYKEICARGGVPGKELFPIVEMRMNNILMTKHKKNGVQLNFHIIFDNDPDILTTAAAVLNALPTLDDSGNPTILGALTDKSKATFDFKEVITKLEGAGLHEKHALIWLPYDEYGGIDEIDPNVDGCFKQALIKRSHFIGTSTEKQIRFFKWEDPKHPEEKYEEWLGQRKPCIKGSDAHSSSYPFGHLMDADSQPIKRHCWVNAQPTFTGLKHLLTEPDRIFIGSEPELLSRVRENPTKFIHSISIDRIDGVSPDEVWFEKIELNLNSSLVAVIGNKGSGKSAITDIIALAGNTHQDPKHFSFLSPAKFRKKRPHNLSEKFGVKLTWQDSKAVKMRLSDNPDKNNPERVRYLPQSFLESICGDVESKDFEKELKKIIFAHTEEENKLNCSTLDELIDYQSDLVNENITTLKSEISKLNSEIVQLEEKGHWDYINQVRGLIRLKKDELAAHKQNKPEPPAIQSTNGAKSKHAAELETLHAQVSDIQESISAARRILTKLKKNRADLNHAHNFFKNLNDELALHLLPNGPHIVTLRANSIDPSNVFSYTVDVSPILSALEKVDATITDVAADIAKDTPGNKADKLIKLQERVGALTAELEKPEREQQEYLEKLRLWQERGKELVGGPDSEGSLRCLRAKRDYVKNQLNIDIENKRTLRNDYVRQLFVQKLKLKKIREDLFDPVSQFIADVKELSSKYKVELDVMFDVSTFIEGFLDYINQTRVGSFNGKEDGYDKVDDLLQRTEFSTESGLFLFLEEIEEMIRFDMRSGSPEPVDVASQLRKGKKPAELYDFLYQLDYLEPIYNLKLDDKTLPELSPGERGALLLIFYLVLDTEDIPLVIDQPEDNLDNESIYRVLVHFIKKVKNKRQVIIVTHNANLAIVCDAEQIIRAEIDKKNGNRVIYTSGAIEDRHMNLTSVNVLEGTMPAFDNRKSKYHR